MSIFDINDKQTATDTTADVNNPFRMDRSTLQRLLQERRKVCEELTKDIDKFKDKLDQYERERNVLEEWLAVWYK